MAFIRTTRADEATGAARDMYARQQAHWGFVPNYAKVFSDRPEVMARWGRLLAEIRRPTEDYRFELVTLVVALELKHSACSLAHGNKLAELTDIDTVVAIASGDEASVLDARDLAIAAYARSIARDARRITNGQVEALRSRHGLGDDEIFDIAAIASARCFFTKILDALGTEPDVSVMKLDERLRRALTVGRPVSHAQAELLPVAGVRTVRAA